MRGSTEQTASHNKHMGKARVLSYFLGVLALCFLVASSVLLVFVREYQTVVTSLTSAVAQASVSATQDFLSEPQLGTVVQGENALTYLDLLTVTSPVVSVASVLPVPTVTPIVYEPGEVDFALTTSLPLQVTPNTVGFVALAPDASFMVSSYDNGFAAFAQYYSEPTNSGTIYSINSNSYSPEGNINSIYLTCTAANTTLTVHPYASSVGAVGYRSIATSKDGVRVYVGYRQPFTNTDLTAPANFPFLQLAGAVATYTVPYQTYNHTSQPLLTSYQLTYSCTLSVQNPFGAQTAGLSPVYDPVSQQTLTGDDFGSIIRTSINQATGNRTLAVRGNFGIIQSNGALIAVYEETTSTTQEVVGLIQLFSQYGTFPPDSAVAFGKDFDMGNDTIMAAVRNPGYLPYQLLYFRRNLTSNTWQHQQTLIAPNSVEDFGVSLSVSNDGNMTVVGAPQLPDGTTPGLGGTLYVYARSSDKNSWTLAQSVTDPFASSHSFGAFGYFLSVDPLYLMLAVTANQNNALNVAASAIGTVPSKKVPSVVLLPILQSTGTLDTANAQEIPYAPVNVDAGVATDLIDPLYGATTALAFVDQNPKNYLTIFLGSPLNRLMQLYIAA